MTQYLILTNGQPWNSEFYDTRDELYAAMDGVTVTAGEGSTIWELDFADGRLRNVTEDMAADWCERQGFDRHVERMIHEDDDLWFYLVATKHVLTRPRKRKHLELGAV